MSGEDVLVTASESGTAKSSLYAPTWRYIGDRDAADLAYSARFGVAIVPEPSIAPGGAWAYALPAVDQRT